MRPGFQDAVKKVPGIFPPARKWRGGRAILALLFLLAGAVLAHEGHDALPTKGAVVRGDLVKLDKEARAALAVRTADAENRTLESTILAQAAASVDPRAHAFATTLLSGRVEQVLATPGQRVQAGETLALIRSLDLERLHLEAVTASLDLQLAQQALDRAESLNREGTLGQRDVLLARNRRQERANALIVSQLKLQALGVDAAQTSGGLLPVRSPIAGIVAVIHIQPGVMANPLEHLFNIVDPGRLRVQAFVPEAYVDRLAVGNEARVHFSAFGPEAKPFLGVVAAREGKVDPKTLTETIWIDLAAAPGVVPGMAGTAEIVVHKKANAVAVPADAVIQDGVETYVFLQSAPGEYKRTLLATGLRMPRYVEALTGVLAGAPLVIQGQRQLSSLFITTTLKPSAEARRNAGIRVEKVGRQELDEVISADAVLELPPNGKALAAAPLDGKIQELAIIRPAEVQPGQPLVRISSLAFQNLQLELIQADLAARLHRDTLAAYRQADPESRGIVPKQFIQEAGTSLELAQARRDSLKRQLESIGMQPAETEQILTDHQVRDSFWLRAPRGGHVLPLDVALGQVVKEGAGLFEVQDRRRLWVRGQVDEQGLPRLRVGQEARLRLSADPAYLAQTRILRIEQLVETVSRSRGVWGEIDNPEDRLREDQLGRLTIVIGKTPAVLAVPLTALSGDGSDLHVFVYDAKTEQFQRRAVTTGRRDDRHAEVLSGLEAGETIATAGVAPLARGYGRIK